MGSALLSPRDAAKHLHISERTLRDLKKRGAIRYVALTDRRIAYRTDDLAEYITNRVRCDEQPEPGATQKRRVSASAPNRTNIVPFSEILRQR